MPKYIDAPHAKTADSVCAFFGVNAQKGLKKEQVEQQRKEYGLNELAKEEQKSLISLILEQFEDLLVRILLAAACVSFALAYFEGHGESEGITAYIEPLVILLILIANAVVGVWQESNAESALEALKSLQPELAHVYREGKLVTISASELVPGDIVEVRVGDKIPADMRVIQLKTTTLKVEQSQLTGESQSVMKQVEPISTVDCEIQAQVNMLFGSTTVANGAAIGVVTHTGMATEMGKIHSAVQEANNEDSSTPLQKKLDEFGESLSKVIGVICVVVWAINYKNFSDPIHGSWMRGCVYYFKIAVALAVAAIPEGLPAVITTCLALGTRKMAKKNAIVRRLPSVETLGCTTVICSDKTGTLTTNEMTAIKFVVPKSAKEVDVYNVHGHNYTPIGKIRAASGSQEELTHIAESDKGLQYFAKTLALCNESTLEIVGGKYSRIGEPTEAALRVLVEKLGCPDKKINEGSLQNPKRDPQHTAVFSEYWSKDVSVLATLEFCRDRKSMSVLVKEKGAKTNVQYVKGAPESVFERCDFTFTADGKVEPLTSEMRKKLQAEVDRMSGDALRCLAAAVRLDCKELKDYDGAKHKAHALLVDSANFAGLEKNLVFAGLVGILDPPRPEVSDAIKQCKDAGIKVIMITGDNKLTAEAIGSKIGIKSDVKTKFVSLTGKEFEALPEEKKVEILTDHGNACVFSRTEPRHKQMIVKILRDAGEICAMTGDGVNDAPALKMADIGIAMGIAGTEVAKEASDMVLADDNFSTIVVAVEEGRSIYNNMKAFIRYLISSNIGEVASIFITAALGIPESLAPVQLLWVNLVTDGLPATALGFNPPDVDVMSKPPRRTNDSLISQWVFFRYLVIGTYVGIATVGIFVWWFVYGIDPADNNTLVTFDQLSHWGHCHTWEGFKVNPVFGMDGRDPCAYFSAGKIKACTLSLTVLVIIEMFNALNALSEDGSLLQMPPWANPWLVLAIAGSVIVHLAILYIPWLSAVFNVVPLSLIDWYHVLLWSSPVIFIDEILKFIARCKSSRSGVVFPREKGE